MAVEYDFPWEREAMRGDPMPDKLSLSDQAAYQAVALLYARFRARSIERDAAGQEKKLIRAELEKRKSAEAFDAKLSAYHIEVTRKTECARAAYRKAATEAEALEAAALLVEAIDNVPCPPFEVGGSRGT